MAVSCYNNREASSEWQPVATVAWRPWRIAVSCYNNRKASCDWQPLVTLPMRPMINRSHALPAEKPVMTASQLLE